MGGVILVLIGLMLGGLGYLVGYLLRNSANKLRVTDSFKNKLGLTKMMKLDVISASELDEIAKIYRDKSIKEKELEEYEKYMKVLTDLTEMGYLNTEQYNAKLDKLNKCYNIVK